MIYSETVSSNYLQDTHDAPQIRKRLKNTFTDRKKVWIANRWVENLAYKPIHRRNLKRTWQIKNGH